MTNQLATGCLGDTAPAIDADEYSSVLHLMETSLVRYADKPAIRCYGEVLSYAELDQQSALLASYLQNILRVNKGDRIASMMPNIPAFPVTLLGILRAGAVQVNVNPLYTVRELRHQLLDSECEVIIVHAGATPALAEVLADTQIRNVIVVGSGSCLDAEVETPACDPRLSDAVRFSAALREGARKPYRPVELRGEDLIFLQYTGGTTGLSKAAELTHRNVVAATRQIKTVLGNHLIPGNEVVVTAIPLYHIFALCVNLLVYFEAGAENWLVPNPRNLDDFISTLKAAQPTALTGVNTLYNSLLSHAKIGEVDWSRLRYVAGGGAAIQRATSDRWQALTGHGIHEGYGLSETSVGISTVPPHVAHFTGTAGPPTPGTHVKLLDDVGEEVPAGSPGEIVVKGPQVMRAYWNQPEATAASFTSDGYFRTGDIGQFDDQGFLKIVDRKKDMVLVSGFNVYPAEVEAVASEASGVFECAAVGIPSATSGEMVTLFVVRAPNATISEADLLAHCKAQLAAYKVPKSIRFVDALPKSAVGKVLRRELRTQA